MPYSQTKLLLIKIERLANKMYFHKINKNQLADLKNAVDDLIKAVDDEHKRFTVDETCKE